MAVTSLPAGFDWWPGGLLGDAHLAVGKQLPQCKRGHTFLKAEVIRELIVSKGVQVGRKGLRVRCKGFDFAELRGKLQLSFSHHGKSSLLSPVGTLLRVGFRAAREVWQ